MGGDGGVVLVCVQVSLSSFTHCSLGVADVSSLGNSVPLPRGRNRMLYPERIQSLYEVTCHTYDSKHGVLCMAGQHLDDSGKLLLFLVSGFCTLLY